MFSLVPYVIVSVGATSARKGFMEEKMMEWGQNEVWSTKVGDEGPMYGAYPNGPLRSKRVQSQICSEQQAAMYNQVSLCMWAFQPNNQTL